MMVGAGNLAALDVLSNAAAVIAEGKVMQLAAMRNADISEITICALSRRKPPHCLPQPPKWGHSPAPQTEIEALKSYGKNLALRFNWSMTR